MAENMLMRPGVGKGRRRALGWTQVDLARAVGVSVPTISQWERGQREVTPDRQDALALALGGRRGLFRQAVRAVCRVSSAEAGR